MIAALGLAPHSGWAALIGVGGSSATPRVLVRERIEMASSRDPESRQPYHAVEGLEVAEAARRLAGYAATAERMAHRAIERTVGQLDRDGHRVVGLGILEAAGRKGASLAAVLASHALIHSADGDHFRNAIAAAGERCHLTATRVRTRDLDREAAAAIGKAPLALQQAVRELGRELGPPWAADQKAAALLAGADVGRGSPNGRSRPMSDVLATAAVLACSLFAGPSSWGDDGTILFAPASSGELLRVPGDSRHAGEGHDARTVSLLGAGRCERVLLLEPRGTAGALPRRVLLAEGCAPIRCAYNDYMTGRRVGSRELKTRLGTYLRQVGRGATLVVTDRGRPVAELRPASAGGSELDKRLQELALLGVVACPEGRAGLPPFRPIVGRGRPLSEAIREDRDDRF